MDTSFHPWICCQLGAREHYAVPRALWRHRHLDRLVTDAWTPAHSPFARLSDLPAIRRLKDRYHRDLQQASIRAFTGSLLAFETVERVRRTGHWERIMARNRWFESQTVKTLRRSEAMLSRASRGTASGAPILFAYSYAALEILRYAKSRGWHTVLGQIDPGLVEENVVREECAREPTLCQEWQPALVAYWQNWQEELLLADTIVVNSLWTLAALRTVGVPAEKLRVLPLAYEESSLRSPPKQYPERFTSQRPLRVLFLGQINLRKGIARLLRAAARLPDVVEFWMVGPKQIADDAALTRHARIRWLGPCTRNLTANYYQQADVFLLPTLSDGFALTQLEAMDHRLPVIASKNCGAVVRDGIDGLELTDPTVDAIEHALLYCLEDPRRLAAFSTAAHVREEFSMNSLSENLLDIERRSLPLSKSTEH